MKIFWLLTVAAFFMGAAAQSTAQIDLSASANILSQYRGRGITQDPNAVFQPSLTASHDSGFFANIWGSPVDFGENDPTGANLEIDYTLGFKQTLKNFSFGVSKLYYTYPGTGEDFGYDFRETIVTIGYQFGPLGTQLKGAYSPDFFGNSGKALYTELSGNYQFSNGWGMFGHIGRQTFSQNELAGKNYTDYELGVSQQIADNFSWQLAYQTSTLRNICNICGTEVVGALKFTY